MSQPSALRRWLAAPSFASEEHTQRARAVHRVAWATLLTATFFLLLLAIEDPATLERRLFSILYATVIVVTALELNRRRWTQAAGWVLIVGLTGVVTLRGWTLGGIDSPTTAAFVVMVTMGGVLLGIRAGVAVAVGCAAIILLLALAEVRGVLPVPHHHPTPLGKWLINCIWIGLAISLQGQIAIVLREALRRARSELDQRKHAEQRLRLALDAGSVSVWDQDVETRRFSADPELFQLYGIPVPDSGSVPFETWAERVHPEDRERMAQILRTLAEGAPHARTDFRIVTPDGATRMIEGSAVTVLDDEQRVQQIVGVNVDVSERRAVLLERDRLVHDLQERVKELRLLHQSALILQRARVSGSEALPELVPLMTKAWQYPECCEVRISFRDDVAATPGFRQTEWMQVKTFTTEIGDGTIEVAYTEPRPLADEGPFLAEERALLDSLAEMLVAYIEVRRRQGDLEGLVATRTAQLQAAREAADRANSAKSVFLANMSHEIRTPMNAVLGYAQLLTRDSSLSEPQRRKIGAILSSGTHLLTVINDVLEMSKIEAGGTKLVLSATDLHAMLLEIEQMFGALTSVKGLELRFERAPGVPRTILGDAAKLRQVVINLLSNAVKFTERGSVDVRTSSEALAERLQRITIEVSDTGAGIELADQARIFGAFEQSDQGTRAGGSGLGLAISRNFARLMQGELTVTSVAGEGSTFAFSFEAEVAPAVEAQAQAGSARDTPVCLQPGTGPRRVLVVEDRAENRELLEELLSNLGFETRTAATGEDAITTHRAWSPHLVLMDLRMPGIGGLEAIRRLRVEGSRAVLIALTGSAIDAAHQQARDVGADEVILKPYVESALLERIGALLNVRYVYRRELTATSAPEASAPREDLLGAAVLGRVPGPLLERLRAAATQARGQRIELVADEVAATSSELASAIRVLARDFRYDALIAAVDAVAPGPKAADGPGE